MKISFAILTVLSIVIISGCTSQTSVYSSDSSTPSKGSSNAQIESSGSADTTLVNSTILTPFTTCPNLSPLINMQNLSETGYMDITGYGYGDNKIKTVTTSPILSLYNIPSVNGYSVGMGFFNTLCQNNASTCNVDCYKGSAEGENINYYYCGNIRVRNTIIDSSGNIINIIDKLATIVTDIKFDNGVSERLTSNGDEINLTKYTAKSIKYIDTICKDSPYK